MRRIERFKPLLAPTVFALLTGAMFFDVLCSESRVLSSESTDLALQFFPWREFGFSQLRSGNLALWNPHIYGGTPYFAGFQSALLYPPNWLHLILPTTVAINWIIALHVFCAGYFTCLWLRSRDVSLAGSILGGAIFMFSGPYFLHIYAGHLPHVCVMVWASLILMSIDGLARSADPRWAVLGMIAVAFALFAGHPQYVYYTGIAGTLYGLVLLMSSKHRIGLIAGLIAIYAGGAMLAAVQLLPGIEVTRESIRGAGTAYEFASTFSLPPANLLTLIAPKLFGTVPQAYWGAGYVWEMCLFASVSGLVLALLAVVLDRRRPVLVAALMVALMLVLALGRHTPLYRVLYEYVPMYGGFRGTVKFSYLAVLYIALLAGFGFDALRRRAPSWFLSAGLAAAGAIAFLSAGLIVSSSSQGSSGWWGRWLAGFATSYSAAGELFSHRAEQYLEPDLIVASAEAAARSLAWAAATSILVACILIAARWRARAVYLLIPLLLFELFGFARSTRATMQPIAGFPTDSRPQIDATYRSWEAKLKQIPREVRVLTVMPQFANLGMLLGFDNLWGYDPIVLRRYAELLAASQGQNPDSASQYLAFRQVPIGMFRMLRCGLILVPDESRPTAELADPLPVATLVGYWVVLTQRDAILQYLLSDNFDPRFAIVLESDPGIASSEASAAGGSVEVVTSTTDSVELRASLLRPSLLLITNNFARGWSVRSLLEKPPQQSYRLMPANYTLQAIPLQRGTHHLLIEYAPLSFRIGWWITGLSVGLMLFACLLLRRGRFAGNPCASR